MTNEHHIRDATKLIMFPDELPLRQVNRKYWQFVQPYCIDTPWGRIIIPEGYVCDLTSVPWWARWVARRRGPHEIAAAVHDFLYCKRPFGRRTADLVFRWVLEQLGIGPLRRWTMFAAVRLGGWPSWYFEDELPGRVHDAMQHGDLIPAEKSDLLTSQAEPFRWEDRGDTEVWRRSRDWDRGEQLWQGATDTCAPHALANAAQPFGVEVDPWDAYERCKAIDGFPDLPGTTLVALRTVAEELYGDRLEFQWIFSVEALQRWITEDGTAVGGFVWRAGMAYPSSITGRMRIRGPSYGGHAVAVKKTRHRGLWRARCFGVECSNRTFGRQIAWMRWEDVPAAVVPGERHVFLGVKQKG